MGHPLVYYLRICLFDHNYAVSLLYGVRIVLGTVALVGQLIGVYTLLHEVVVSSLGTLVRNLLVVGSRTGLLVSVTCEVIYAILRQDSV